MGEKMPIEKLRDRLRELSMRDEAVTNTPDTLARWADIVDAHLTQPAQAVDAWALRHLVLSWRERENTLLAKNDDLSASKSLAYEQCADDLDQLLTAALPSANGKEGDSEDPPTCPICDQMKLSARCSACGYEDPTTGAAR